MKNWIFLLVVLGLSGCGTVQRMSCNIEAVNTAIERNKEVVDSSSYSIRKNYETVDRSTAAIEANQSAILESTEAVKGNLQSVDQSTQAISQNAKVIKEVTGILANLTFERLLLFVILLAAPFLLIIFLLWRIDRGLYALLRNDKGKS